VILWLKRNLYLGVAILVAVALTGVGGYFVWTKKQENNDLETRLDEFKAKIEELTKIKPTPTKENVQAATADSGKASSYDQECKPFFPDAPYQTLSSQGYKTLLESTISALRKQAAASSVLVPTNPPFCFSFEAQTKPMTFEPGSIKPLAQQLFVVSEVCHALFRARIHKLDQIRRVAVSQYDSGAGQGDFEILAGETVTSNRWTGLAVWPYEFTMECFSTEFATALEEISKIPRMYIVKTVYVETLPPTIKPPGFGMEPPGGRAPVGPPPGPGGRGGGRGGPGPRSASVTVLDEELLRVTMLIHVVKPL
jgi:hypothetical protein